MTTLARIEEEPPVRAAQGAEDVVIGDPDQCAVDAEMDCAPRISGRRAGRAGEELGRQQPVWVSATRREVGA